MKLYCLSPPNMPTDELGCLEFATDYRGMPDPTTGLLAFPMGDILRGVATTIEVPVSFMFIRIEEGYGLHHVRIFGPALEALIEKCGLTDTYDPIERQERCDRPNCLVLHTYTTYERPPTASKLVAYLEDQLKEETQ